MPDRLILLSIDGIRASALGAYGNTACQTPAFDQLASESLLVEWALAESPHTASMCGELFRTLKALGDVQLVTDDPGLGKTEWTSGLCDLSLLPEQSPTDLAGTIAETTIAETFAHFADATAKIDTAMPRVLWLHTRGMTGPWDAPQEMVIAGVEEDDPLPELSVSPASGPYDPSEDQDAMFKASCRYNAQVAVLDACLEGWLEVYHEVSATQQLHLIVCGTGGYALGEHGILGRQEVAPYSESRQVPLLFRGPKPRLSHRCGRYPCGLSASLKSSIEAQLETSEAALQAAAAPAVCLSGQGSAAVTTDEWMLIARDEVRELYAKPDDRWEANDVASLRGDVVEELSTFLEKQ